MVVKKGQTPVISDSTIMYIDQAAATSAGVSFSFIPRSTPDCEILLGGVFTSGDSPVVLGELLGKGVTVSGSVKSYNPKVTTTLELYVAGTTTNPTYTTTIAAQSTGSGQVTQSFSFTSVAAGTYDLVVSKADHVPYKITGIVVDSSDIDLTSHANAAIKTITPPCGDINAGKTINGSDANIVLSSSNYNKTTASAANTLSDLNGDGLINGSDVNVLLSSANYNKGTANATVAF